MTREEKINTLKAIIRECEEYQWQRKETLFEIIKNLEQEPCQDAINQIFKRMWNCRGKHTTSIDKVRMEQIIRDELPFVTQTSGK